MPKQPEELTPPWVVQARMLLEVPGRIFQPFSANEFRLFLALTMRYGLDPVVKSDAAMEEILGQQFLPHFSGRTALELVRFARVFLDRLLAEKEGSTIGFDPEFSERMILVRCGQMYYIRSKIQDAIDEAYARNVNPTLLFNAEKSIEFGVDLRQIVWTKEASRTQMHYTEFWAPSCDMRLFCAILKHGFKHWMEIVCDPEVNLVKQIDSSIVSRGDPIGDHTDLKTLQKYRFMFLDERLDHLSYLLDLEYQ